MGNADFKATSNVVDGVGSRIMKNRQQQQRRRQSRLRDDDDAAGQKNGHPRDAPSITTTTTTTKMMRGPLRAESFWRKEQAAFGDDVLGNNGSGDRDAATDDLDVGIDDDVLSSNRNEQQQKQQQSKDQDTDMIISQLQENIQRLSDKCSALESQNILVAVQQLDWLVMILSWSFSLLTMYVYWQIVTYGIVPTLVEWILPTISDGPDEGHDTILGKLMLPVRLANYFFFINTIRLSSVLSLCLKGTFLVIPYSYNAYTYGSFHRRFQVFAVAFIILGRIRLCRWREKHFVQSTGSDSTQVPTYGEACTDDGIWEANYEISARFLYLSVSKLRGLWTKSAQYLSSRADFMPVSYIRELSKLQDSAPATNWDDVQHWLSPTLRKSLVELDTTPLASASIGQVHIATIRTKRTRRRQRQSNDGMVSKLHDDDDDDEDDKDDDEDVLQKVVIKIQHPHARTLMMDDFWSLLVICRIVGWLEPEYAFMEILMREWAMEARKELDFTNELYHMEQAQKALEQLFPSDTSVVYTNPDSTGRRIPFRAEVPKALSEYSNRTVLVMEYCEGCRVDDFPQLAQWKLDRLHVMDGVAQTFAHFMYCTNIFNGDPHPGNLLCRPGLGKTVAGDGNGCGNDADGSFTLVLLDWGLAKQLSDPKRLAFCQMVYAAATLDYGLLLDSYKTLGLRMKREDAGQSMEDMRFFLRDMAPRSKARQRIKSKMKQGQELAKRNKEKVPMESKAYPGELFFFIRVNELLHGLGSKFQVDLKYLDALRPYAEQGLRSLQSSPSPSVKSAANATPTVPIHDQALQEKLQQTLKDLESEDQFSGGQICILNSNGEIQVDVVAGNLGGLKDHIPMQRDALILGYSCTKAITATLAHIMVEEGYLTLDEPVCNRVWKSFCASDDPPSGLAGALGISSAEVARRWKWKRQITLRHILNHSAGLWSAFPSNLTIKGMASCETCCKAFEYDPDKPAQTLLPSRMPGEKSEYHFMSYGWLVAGTLRGAYAIKHKCPETTYAHVYEAMLFPKLSDSLKFELGFRPLGGGYDNFVLANTVTSDVRASKFIQEQRENRSLEGIDSTQQDGKQADEPTLEVMKMFKGVEFLLDPRIWNSQDALDANVPAAGGRFSAAALARFYHELGNSKSFVPERVFDEVSVPSSNDVDAESTFPGMQGVTRIANDSNNQRTKLSLGFQLIQTDRDVGNGNVYSGIGHAGVGGSIGFWHRPSGLAIGVMLNKADGGESVTLRILQVISEHYKI